MTVFRSTSVDFCFPLPHLLALPTEAWRGAEIRRHLAENVYINLPGPKSEGVSMALSGRSSSSHSVMLVLKNLAGSIRVIIHCIADQSTVIKNTSVIYEGW